MQKTILWVDDDYYNFQSLFHPLEKAGIIVDYALSAVEGYKKVQNRKKYSLIVTDMIIPLTKDSSVIPQEVTNWEKEEFLGIGFIKWLRYKQEILSPIVILSVIDDPIETYNLNRLSVSDSISKRGLLPSELAKRIKTILGI